MRSRFLMAGCGVALIAIGTFFWYRLATAPVPVMAALSADHAHERVGLDGLHCWKVAVTEAQFNEAMNKLGLITMETYPPYDTSAANCSAVWWDIDLPKQAQRYWRSQDGHTRKLATYSNGRLYFAHENR